MRRALPWLPVAFIRLLSTVLPLVALFCASDAAFAYPSSTVWRWSACESTNQGSFSSAQEACDAVPKSGSNSVGVRQSNGACGTNNTNMYYVTHTEIAGTSCKGMRTQSNGTYGPFTYGTLSSTSGCPGGGTLQSGQCVCPVGSVDTGSSCEDASSCPEGQFKELADGPCIPKCPEGQGNGAMEYPPPASKTSGICGPRRKIGGLDVLDHLGNEVLCEYAGTGVTVCADMGNGTMCHSEMTYNLGLTCGGDSTVPEDTTPCGAGELYCDKGPGACPSGFTPGDFNGRALCVKNGEAVNVVKRTQSALDPPKDPPLPDAPDPLPNSTTGGTDGNPEIFDSVVSVGSGASTTGGGSGTGEDIITCGLPNTPKCKIDETGTPTKGDFGSATTALNDASKAREDGLATVTSAQGKQTSWSWNLALPTGCQPLSLNMLIKTVVFDPCAYQAVFHDLMSMLWAGATLFAVFGMVGRTLRES